MNARYTRTAIILHWLIALGVIGNVTLALSWPHAADERVRPMIDLHKSVGITILGLAIMRLLWRATHKPPAFAIGYKRWEVTVAHIVHWLLYFVIFAMPLTGWIMDSGYKDAATHPMFLYGLFEWPRIGFIMHLDPATRDRVHDLFGEAHELIAWLVFALFALHVAGALKHQLEGHKELQRMLP
jgi:cytochrome b561